MDEVTLKDIDPLTSYLENLPERTFDEEDEEGGPGALDFLELGAIGHRPGALGQASARVHTDLADGSPQRFDGGDAAAG